MESKLLNRQLNRCGLEEEKLPADLTKWQEFLKRIAKNYAETDQERYLLERSMEISSRELQDLNKQLEHAQSLAKLGYWSYDRVTGKIGWSKEMYYLFELEPGSTPPAYDEAMSLIHEEDRPMLEEAIEKAFKEGQAYDVEIRIKHNKLDDYKWYRAIGNPHVVPGKKIEQLSGVLIDIHKHKSDEEQLEELHQQLLTTARSAGMAEVATSILHNIGNVLNSANVSINLVHENINQSSFKKLEATKELLEKNKNNLTEYLCNDPQGKLIPTYLLALIEKIQATYATVSKEVESLREHLNHIKDITQMQESISGVKGIIERTNIPELINAAINMCKDSVEKRNIKLETNFSDNYISINTDKSKLLQVLVNLIQNAKDALDSTNISDKLLKINLKKNSHQIEIEVTDNGIGISPENLGKIFNFGFTTKKQGHGFGLHSSALTIKDLGGNLIVESKGLNQGATFKLSLPLVMTKYGQEGG